MKGNRKKYTNYKGISLSHPGKVYAKCLERRCREIVKSKWKNGQYGFIQVAAPRTKVCKECLRVFYLEKADDQAPRYNIWSAAGVRH